MRNCPICKLHDGRLSVRGKVTVTVTDADSQPVELLRVACKVCGYTILFDSTVMSSSPYAGDDGELPPRIGDL